MRVEDLHDFMLELPRLRAQLLRVLGPDSCIETTRFLIGVLGTMGVEARPVSVLAHLANKAATRGIQDGSNVSAQGGHVVIIGDRQGPAISKGRWHGHLAAQAGSVLIDGSLDQANRPAKGIHAEAGAFLLPPAWDDGQPASYDLPKGGSLTYWIRAGDTSYKRTPAWRNGYRLFLQWHVGQLLVVP